MTYCGISSFNPLPSQKQGETTARTRPISSGPVSIRSPHKSKGRHEPDYRSPRYPTFQSAPLTKARGDCCPSIPQSDLPRFNPLPSQKQGETDYSTPHRLWYSGFNPLPSQKQGETVYGFGRGVGWLVSIRSPHKSKGRLGRDRSWGLFARRFNPLPSQKQGETWVIRF